MSNLMADPSTREGYEHIPPQPRWVFFIRMFQFVVSLVVLGLSAYAGSGIGIFGAGYGLGIFTFVWTFIYLVWLFISTRFKPTLYNMWAQLILEIFCVIWWLAAFASLAEYAAVWSIGQDYLNDSYCSYYNNCGAYNSYNSQANATKAAAALGAFVWISFIVTLIVFSMSLHRVRTANLNAAPPVFQEHKMENVQPAPQQENYAPQPYVQPVDHRYEQQTMA